MTGRPEGEQPELERLSASTAWVRSLALAIARDPHLADDISQESWLAWVQGGHREQGSLARWFSGTLRNLLRLRRRSEGRREDHELLAHAPAQPVGPEVALERIELQEVLLRAVRELEEPYRTTIVLRWFEELEPLEIARRTGVPVRTVHTRVTRGLQILRRKLDGRLPGSDRTWLAVLVALLGEPSSVKGALAVKATSKVLVVGAILTAATLVLVAVRPWSAPAVAAGGAGTPLIADESSEGERVVEPELTAKADEARTPVTAPTTATAVVQSRAIYGTALDVAGIPVVGVKIGFTASGGPHGGPPSSIATTNGLGAFESESDAASGKLYATDERWTTVYGAQVGETTPEQGYVLALAPRIELEGRVVDQSGSPIEGAAIRVDRPGVFYMPGRENLSRPGRFASARTVMLDPLHYAIDGLDDSPPNDWTTLSGDRGRFRIDDAPGIQGARLVASKDTYLDKGHAIEGTDRAIEIVLQRSIDAPGRIRGRVVDEQGEGLHGAKVFLGFRSATTDHDGQFELDALGAGGTRLIAIHEGSEPAIQACLHEPTDSPGAWPDPLELVIPKRECSIRGIVVDPDGEPKSGVEVGALEPPTWAQLLSWAGESFDPSDHDAPRAIGGDTVRTGADGRFEVTGLYWRNYGLRALDRATLALVTTEPIAVGGEDLVIRFGGRELLTRYAGSVVDLRGQPIAEARVSLRRTLPASDGRSTSALELNSVVTDSAGKFGIESAAADLEIAQVQVEQATPWSLVPIGPAQDRQALVLRVGRPGRFVVELGPDSVDIDGFHVLDPDGNELGLGASQGAGGWIGSGQWSIRPGQRSAPIMVSETGVTLVLTRKGTEKARVPIQVVPGEVTVVRL